jgi:uncharacterized membrane protein
MIKNIWQQIQESLKGKSPGLIGGMTGLALALSLVIFGVLKTLLIIGMTLLGMYLGARYFSNKEVIRNLLDKILPPGMFR